ncbi:hypothetical protein EYF80_028404 [Liparis tanakae]|uniref:Uncharacterized protein n=1 Tax=Liparis tanakae TaxID=230148 RepID=A0A4Z2H670_9TELE|nr:hypothetical protein EYF80_028404 [Liparis tanakae]
MPGVLFFTNSNLVTLRYVFTPRRHATTSRHNVTPQRHATTSRHNRSVALVAPVALVALVALVAPSSSSLGHVLLHVRPPASGAVLREAFLQLLELQVSRRVLRSFCSVGIPEETRRTAVTKRHRQI